MIHLVAVGACYLDTILDVPYYPQEDEKLRATTLTKRRGGNCPNTLEVLQQLLHAHQQTHTSSQELEVGLDLVSVLPRRSSPAVHFIRESLVPDDREGPQLVSLDRCIYRDDHEEPASAFIVRSEATGSRTSVNYNDLPEMRIEELIRVVESLKEEKGTDNGDPGAVSVGEGLWLHFEGRIPEVTLQCIQHIRKKYRQVRISVEIEKPGRPGLQDLVTEADLVFFSRGWAQAQGYKNYEECLRDQARFAANALVLCCTWGQSGAAAIEPKTGIYRHSNAWASGEPCTVDTIGAGDTFIAGMLYAYMLHARDWSVEEKLDFSNEVAGRKVIQEGFRGLGRGVSKGPLVQPQTPTRMSLSGMMP